MQNKVKVVVCGKEYSLQTTEQPDYLIGLAKKLDKQISTMTNSSDTLSASSASVLVALAAMDDATKATDSIDNIRTQIKGYVDDAARARLERDEAVKELDHVKARLSRVESDFKLYKLKDNLPSVSGNPK